MSRWVGIDCGYSHLAAAVVHPDGEVLRCESTDEPEGDGHDREVALGRLEVLLNRLSAYRDVPVMLAGYCYDSCGVLESFMERGWRVDDVVALNDAVGVYGLTGMQGHAVVAACGSWPQVFYADRRGTVQWPGGDAKQALPDWLLCGSEYSQFLRQSGTERDPPEHDFRDAGYRLERLVDQPEARQFVRKAAEAARITRDVFWRFCGQEEAPLLVLGGGAVRGARVWRALQVELANLGVQATRVTGDQAVGLVRFARSNPTADPWGYIGNQPPSWLE